MQLVNRTLFCWWVNCPLKLSFWHSQYIRKKGWVLLWILDARTIGKTMSCISNAWKTRNPVSRNYLSEWLSARGNYAILTMVNDGVVCLLVLLTQIKKQRKNSCYRFYSKKILSSCKRLLEVSYLRMYRRKTYGIIF